jgi:hypothetical protein
MNDPNEVREAALDALHLAVAGTQHKCEQSASFATRLFSMSMRTQCECTRARPAPAPMATHSSLACSHAKLEGRQRHTRNLATAHSSTARRPRVRGTDVAPSDASEKPNSPHDFEQWTQNLYVSDLRDAARDARRHAASLEAANHPTSGRGGRGSGGRGGRASGGRAGRIGRSCTSGLLAHVIGAFTHDEKTHTQLLVHAPHVVTLGLVAATREPPSREDVSDVCEAIGSSLKLNLHAAFKLAAEGEASTNAPAEATAAWYELDSVQTFYAQHCPSCCAHTAPR